MRYIQLFQYKCPTEVIKAMKQHLASQRVRRLEVVSRRSYGSNEFKSAMPKFLSNDGKLLPIGIAPGNVLKSFKLVGFASN